MCVRSTKLSRSPQIIHNCQNSKTNVYFKLVLLANINNNKYISAIYTEVAIFDVETIIRNKVDSPE